MWTAAAKMHDGGLSNAHPVTSAWTYTRYIFRMEDPRLEPVSLDMTT